MENIMKTVAIVQARMDSNRLPGKTMLKLSGKPLIEVLLKRLSLSKEVSDIVVAIPKNKKNKVLYNFLKNKKYNVYEGSPNNVLKRYYFAAKKYKADLIVRITGDCPLVDSSLVDNLIRKLIKNRKDYVTNTLPPTLPDGLDVEVFTFNTLKRCFKSAKKQYDKEHVTPLMRNTKKFKILNVKNKYDYSDYRWTIDEAEDYKVIKKVYEKFKPRINFSWIEVFNFMKKNPKIFEHNSNFKRNDQSSKSTAQKLWKKAKQIIPGGNMLLSKKPELFLPGKWPTYYSKAKGCEIWDLDGKKFYDMSFMGVGTNILGYSNTEVNNKVFSAIKKSNVTTLNCPEEVKLAEKLIDIHPWADMVKFARTGGEANSIAIRIARAASKKDKVAFCGYHGWHDWYISANLANKKNLNQQLLPNVDIKGIPKALKNTAIPFFYNDFNTLRKIVNKHNIGIIKMEVFRNIPPKKNFLKKVRELANRKKIILIFDECTSGFRENYGGLHLRYGVEPDIAIFGKAIGNGHAITAVIGKKKIMAEAQNTFISSTFWTERSGPVAALKTLEIMKREKTWKVITKIGKKIENGWKKIARRHNLNVVYSGLTTIRSFVIQSPNWIKYKTFISQEMLKKGFLAGNTVYVCIHHNDKILKKYFKYLDEIFKQISLAEKKKNINNFLETPVCETGLRRFN